MNDNQKFLLLITGLFLVLLVAWLSDSGYALNTGFEDYTTSSTSKSVVTESIKSQQTTTETTTTEFHPGKTLWDWMQLLIIPLILAGGAVWFNWNQKKVELELAEKRADTDREIAADRQRQTALDAYYDKMAEFLLEKDLRTSKEGAEVRAVARARTLATLRILDGKRKGALVRFLYESSLITKDDAIIPLEGADLREANLSEGDFKMVDLTRTDLTGADLMGANLTEANLIEANLSEANLSGANLNGANLSLANHSEANFINAVLYKADLSLALSVTRKQLSRALTLEGTLMPDGKIHE
jgi:hypothetical protein